MKSLTNETNILVLPHPACCPLCDKMMKWPNTSSVLTNWVLACEVWFQLLQTLQCVELHNLAPESHESMFADWWHRAHRRFDRVRRKGFNSLVIVGAWWLWKHRDACVFNGASPKVHKVLRNNSDKVHLWCLAWAKGLGALWQR
uniref:Uncharacterized protein n=1 Tax=Arundo donax TaxID=35708 RepID=A0A0A9E012_ARUDO